MSEIASLTGLNVLGALRNRERGGLYGNTCLLEAVRAFVGLERDISEIMASKFPRWSRHCNELVLHYIAPLRHCQLFIASQLYFVSQIQKCDVQTPVLQL